MTNSQPRNPITGQFVSSDDPYQRLLENLAYTGSAAPPPTELPRSLESLHRLHHEYLMQAARRRSLDRTIEAARQREQKFLADRQKERDDQARINDVLRWHEAEEQDKREFLASGGFEEEYTFNRENWVRSEMARGEQIARRLPSFGAI